MRKYFLLCIFFCIQIGISYSQPRVALHSNGTTTIFAGNNPAIDAYNAAVPGDTLYIPGGLLTMPNINKRLVIIGAGHNPDSAIATGITIVNGFSISTSGDSVHLEGLYINGALYVESDYVSIFRCYVNGNLFLNYYYATLNYIRVSECIIKDDIESSKTNFLEVYNSIFSSVQNMNNGTVQNCIVFGRYYGYPYYGDVGFFNCNSSLLQNNIVYNTSLIIVGAGNYSTYKNNIMRLPVSIGNHTFINNYDTLSLNNIFVNHTGTSFSYNNDYHLKNPTLYMGTDATQVGIFGGLNPFKEGTLPRNPHIVNKTIAPYTNQGGELNINFKVTAQQK